MLERQLSRLVRHALRRGMGERSLPWLGIAAVAFVVRRGLRDVEPVRRLRIKPGQRVDVTVREPATG